ncbi:hypothetical protein WICMUC_004131 [Wickerhamomyces mucosus]|uniref:DNA polymerase epsilon subunit B n=1 Tax=Wickerhamomyces mucosus TaxID=1378264 RepID=A0A9P8TBT1_9ASCO|nr:hypothetical protein WICMUC_004131 [Wickerhamomyces mucosus]
MEKPPAVLPIKLEPSNLRPIAYRILSKKHGLNIKSDALKTLSEHIGHKFGIEWRSAKSQLFLEDVAKLWKEQERGLFLSSEGLEEILREIQTLEIKALKSITDQGQVSANSLIQKDIVKALDLGIAIETSTNVPSTRSSSISVSKSLDWREYFKVINAFNQQIFEYDHIRKQYTLAKNQESKISFSSVDSNISLFPQRYHIVKDRIMRNEDFQANNFNPLSSITINEKHTITLVKNLLGRDNQHFLLFGMLVLVDGEWYLQDSSDKIRLDFSDVEPASGSYYTDGNLVLCEGVYLLGEFACSNIYHPDPEKRSETLEANNNLDFLGIHQNSRIDRELHNKLNVLEKELNHKILILGNNCFLDDIKVLDGLKKLFQGVSEEHELPIAIVFNGSFSSSPKHSAEYKTLFDNLASLLEDYPLIVNNVHLIFIPGMNDLWQTSVWPKQNIPRLFGSRLNRLIKNITWASNPTRLVYLSQELVFMRDDIGSRFKRNNINFKSEDNATKISNELNNNIDKIEALPPRISEARKLVKTILDQGHLSPFTKRLKPIIWKLDHIFCLSPLPHVLVLADSSTASFEVTYKGCKCLNPGNLIQRRRLNFIEYNFSTRKSEIKESYF